MSRGRKRRIVVDASHNHEVGHAGIAVATMAGPALAADIVIAENAHVAEAQAVARGIDLLTEMDAAPGSVVVTDCIGVYRQLQPAALTRLDPTMVQRVLAACDERQFKIEWEKRHLVGSAHVPARQALKAWLAGRGSKPTWEEL